MKMNSKISLIVKYKWNGIYRFLPSHFSHCPLCGGGVYFSQDSSRVDLDIRCTARPHRNLGGVGSKGHEVRGQPPGSISGRANKTKRAR